MNESNLIWIYNHHQVGCRPPWDSWSPATIAECDTTEQLAQHEKLDWLDYNYEVNHVL